MEFLGIIESIRGSIIELSNIDKNGNLTAINLRLPIEELNKIKIGQGCLAVYDEKYNIIDITLY